MTGSKGLLAELHGLLGNRLYRILLLWAPLGIGLLFGWTFTWKRVPSEIPVAVWNRDGQALSRDFLRHVDSLQSIRIVRQLTESQTGKALLCSGEVAGFIEIPADFSQRLRSGRAVRIVFYQDFNYLLPGRTLTKAISKLETWQQEKELQNFFTENGLSGSALTFLENPLKIEYHKLFNPSLDYTQFLLPGLLGGLLFQVLFLLGGKLFIAWNQSGKRGLHSLWRMIGAAVAAALIPFAVCYGLLFPLFSLAVADPIRLLFVYILFALATLLMGMLIAALFQREVMTIELIVALGAVAFTLSGFTWPREMYPLLLRHLVGLYPLTWMFEESSKICYQTGYPLDLWPLLGLIVLYAGPLSLMVHLRRNDRAQPC